MVSINWSYEAYIDWSKNPILTTIATTGLPISTIEFPAITICGQVSININI